MSHPKSAPCIAALLLAAGAARRMGARPKCLLEIDGQPLIVRLLHAIDQAGLPAPTIVLGAYAEAISAVVQGRSGRVVMQPDPQADQISSLRLGLAALPPEADAVMVLLADQPLIRAQELTDLIEAYRERPTGVQMLQPQHHGMPGNPAVISRVACAQILAGSAATGAQQWRAQHRDAYLAWPTDNPRYCTDLDSPDDIERLQSQWGLSAHWPADRPQ